jgi:uncharacterized protein YecT (DUF1311 family)
MRLISIVLVALSTTLPATAFAQSPRPVAAAVAQPLSAEQQAKIASLRTDATQKVAALREQVAAKDIELQKLWAAPKPDQDAIRKAEAERGGLLGQIDRTWVDFRLAALAVLTPEQRAAGVVPCPGWGLGGGPGWGPGAGPGWAPVAGQGRGGRGGFGRGGGRGGCAGRGFGSWGGI